MPVVDTLRKSVSSFGLACPEFLEHLDPVARRQQFQSDPENRELSFSTRRERRSRTILSIGDQDAASTGPGNNHSGLSDLARRALSEMKVDSEPHGDTELRASKELNATIERHHRGVNLRFGPI
jgi:hypothetical protein